MYQPAHRAHARADLRAKLSAPLLFLIALAIVLALPGAASAADTTPPSAPTNLAVPTVTGTTATLTWTAATDNVGVVEYDIFKNNSYIDFLWNNGNPPATTYTMTGLTCNTQYSTRVVALDAANNLASSSTVNFTTAACGGSAPAVTISAPAPGSFTSSTSASVSFTATNSPTSTTCKIDAGTDAACTSPKTFTGLSETSHTITVTATNASGSGSAAVTFTVDATAPETTITSGPTAGSTVTTATPTFGFTASQSGSTFACKVDTGAYASCSSPSTTAALSNASHTFYVRATDAAGNTDASPASVTFNVSVSGPDTTPPSAPTNVAASVTTTTATITWTAATDNVGVVEYDIFKNNSYIDFLWNNGNPPATTYTMTGLTCNTQYSTRVVALDAAGNVTSSGTVNFTTSACGSSPGVTISAPASGSTITTSSANVTFSVSNSPTSTTCKLDSAAAAACTSPKAYAGLTDGSHTVTVTAANAYGSTTVATTFTVLTTPPLVRAGYPGYTSIGAGASGACAATITGAAHCWGANEGASGDGGQDMSSHPLPVIALSSGIASIVPGYKFGCALTTGGAVKCWGDNSKGQLGNGTSTNSDVAVAVTGLTSGVAKLDVEGSRACAITSAGGIKCWGSNNFGQLGNGTTVDAATPVDVTGLTSGVASISLSALNGCATLVDGSVKCWGYNTSGQLGSGSTSQYSSTPVAVVGLTSGWIDVSAAGSSSCALNSNGTVKCWGSGSGGQLGQNSQTASLTPVSVPSIPTTGIISIEAASGTHCALTQGGAIYCWGQSGTGTVGSTNPALVPAQVTGFASGAVAIAAGDSHVCALTVSGTVRCWGNGLQGQLGNGDTSGSTFTPVDAIQTVSATSVPLDFTAVGAQTVSCTLDGGTADSGCVSPKTYSGLADGTHTAQVTATNGYGSTTASWSFNVDTTTPTVVVSSPSNGATVTANDGAFYISVSDGNGSGLRTIKCRQAAGSVPSGTWSSCHNGWNQLPNTPLADGTYTVQAQVMDHQGFVATTQSTYTITAPPPTVISDAHFSALVSGGSSTCASATTWYECWGANSTYDHLGIGTARSAFFPAYAPAIPSNLTQLAIGDEFACGLSDASGVVCWGKNQDGQLGNGSTTDSSVPVTVSGLSSGVLSISVGSRSACAVVWTGPKCWGYNASGQLGNGSTTSSATPVDVIGVSNPNSISVGTNHACAALAGGSAKCWGANGSGQLGNGTSGSNSSTPVAVNGLTNVSKIVSATSHTCALLATGNISCWGANGSGQLGTGGTASSSTPVPVSGGLSGVTSVVAGAAHTCALASAAVKCWGQNTYGQVGNGSSSDVLAPATVSGLTSGATMLAAGTLHTCAIVSGGMLKCWGNNSGGELGYGASVSSANQPVDVSTPSYSGNSLYMGFEQTNSLTTTCRLDAGTPSPCVNYGTFNGVSNGAHTITVNVSNSAGSSSLTGRFVADNIAPTVTITAPSDGSSTAISSPTMTISASDSGGTGIASIKCRAATGTYPGGTFKNCSSGQTVPNSPLAVGTYTLQVQVIDAGGNTSYAQATFTRT